MTNHGRYYFILILAQLLWAGNTVAGSMAHGHMGPFALSFARWFVVTLILLPIALPQLKAQKSLILLHWKLIALLSFLGIVLYTSLLYVSLQHTSVIHASIINATVPAFIVLFACIFQKSSLGVHKIVGILLSFFGVLTLISHGTPWILLNLDFNFGDFLSLLASIMWASYSIIIKKLPEKISPLVFLFVASMMSLVLLCPLYLFEASQGISTSLDLGNISLILYLAIGPAILAFTFWTIGIQHVGSVVAGYFINLLPIFAALLAILFLGETLHAYDLFGTFFVLLGIYYANKIKKERVPSVSEINIIN